MINQVILIGKVIESVKLEDNKSKLKIEVKRSFKNSNGIYESDEIECTLWNMIATNTLEYIQIRDIVVVKGRLQVIDNQLEVIAEKISFISSRSDK